MRITIASGKGGTGKTTIATSLALSLTSRQTSRELTNWADHQESQAEIIFLDCDVEAPNAHLFLNPRLEQKEDVSILIPQVDENTCTYCGRCAEVCPWHAIAVVGKRVLVFPQLCHGCGSCTLVCPEGAISEFPNPIGIMEAGSAGKGITFARGVLNVGEPMAVPIIRKMKKWQPASPEKTLIIDASPGTTCPVVEAMREADFVLLVTEPTPFGLHDLRLAVQVASELNIPAGVVINRDGVGDRKVDDYCQEVDLPVLMRIPLDPIIAKGIARGKPLTEIRPEYTRRFQDLYTEVAAIVREAR